MWKRRRGPGVLVGAATICVPSRGETIKLIQVGLPAQQVAAEIFIFVKVVARSSRRKLGEFGEHKKRANIIGRNGAGRAPNCGDFCISPMRQESGGPRPRAASGMIH